MAWYPGAIRMELQPESDNQPAIRPMQFIMHSVAAPWDEKRIYAYWRDSTNLESHFGLDYDGSIGQYIGTQTRADANYRANLRPDGTGAVSIETASDNDATDPWTPEQIEQLIRLGVWLHQTHGIPLRICQTWDDPGYGYHRLHAAWAVSGTDCPGDARVAQFRKIVFPGIVARATHQPSEEDDMPSAAEIWAYKLPIPDGRQVEAGDIVAWTDNRHNVLFKELSSVKTELTATKTALADLTAAVKALTVAAAKTTKEA